MPSFPAPTVARALRVAVLLAAAMGCAKDEAAESAATPLPAAAAPAPTPQPDVVSKDVLSRAPVTERAAVKHVLFGWAELAPAYRGQMDPRAQGRSKAAAQALVAEVLRDLKSGAPIEELMRKHSEDPGSAQTGTPYTATPDAGLVPPFKALSLRLQVDEVGVVETSYGYHVIKRVE
ncbi:MAG: peptidylprolyl isomerase [Myxococcota bacterium]